jgi:anti-anti-sigma factor
VTISERQSGDVTILDLQGRLTLGDATELLRERVNALLAGARQNIVIQLAGVPFVDSAGLGEIVRAVNNAKRAGGAAKLASPTQRIIDLLRIAKVHTFVETFGSDDEAVSSFSK